MTISERAKNRILLLDGAFGTVFYQACGGADPLRANFDCPDIVKKIHADYIAAGADVILTNTFALNPKKLAALNCDAGTLISKAVDLAKSAAVNKAFVALDIGPTGEMLEPYGSLTFETAYDFFAEQVRAGVKAGADAVYIETMTSLIEAKCALLAAKENCDLPVYITMSVEKNGRTFMGNSISEIALTLGGMKPDFLGLNCSAGPREMAGFITEFKNWTDIPLIIKPNAGLPKIIDGKVVYEMSPQEFCAEMKELIPLGAEVIGGCCGTTPEFITALNNLKSIPKMPQKRVYAAAICSGTKTILFDKIKIIGEKINPSGKPELTEALKRGDTESVIDLVLEQAEQGAEILDVNVGIAGIDEAAVMVKAVKAAQSVSDLPLCIDTPDYKAMAAALKIYEGVPIINSVNGSDESLKNILPLAKKYGAMLIGLTLDGSGIPKTAEERFKIAKKIIAAAADCGIDKSKILIDCLTLAKGFMPDEADETLKAVRLVRNELKVKTVLGISNISFGLQGREKLNREFLEEALRAGLDAALANPLPEIMDTVKKAGAEYGL